MVSDGGSIQDAKVGGTEYPCPVCDGGCFEVQYEVHIVGLEGDNLSRMTRRA